MLYICCKCCIPEVTFVSFQQRFFVWRNGKWTSFLISRRTGRTVCDGRLWKQQLSPGPWPSHGNKMEFCGFYFKERQLQWFWGSVRIAPSAQHYWKGSAHTAKTVPSHFLINVPLYHWILHLLRFVGFHIWGQILFWLNALCFSRKNLTTLRSTWSMGELLQASSPDLQQDGAPDHSTRQEPAPEYLSSSFLYDLVSIWPRISRSQSCTLSDTAISWFLSTVPLFSLSLCLHSELSYFGAEPASFSDYIWIYSHGL